MLIGFFAGSLSAQSLFESAKDSSSITASETTDKLSLNGFARGSVFGGGKASQLASTFAEMALQVKYNKGNTVLKSDIRLRKGLFFNEKIQLFQIKELYTGYRGEKIDLLLGNQIINWGRTDGFNPTNNITPNDYFFLSSNPDDQKKSNFMFRLKYRFLPSIELELIGIPFYASSNYRYDLFEMGENVSFGKEIIPLKNLKNGTFAARVNFELPALGWSISYFNGYDPYHGFDVQSVDWSSGLPLITNTSSPYRKTTFGADFAIPLGNLILRGEAAYNITQNPDNKMYIPLTDVGYVAAVETNIGGLTLIGQYIGKLTPDFAELPFPVLSNPIDPVAQFQYANLMIDYENRVFNRKIFYQQEQANNAFSLTFSKSFGYDTFNAELTNYYNFTSKEWLLRPKLSWKITDALSSAVGINFMKGNTKTLFDYSSKVLNGGFIELKASF